MYINNPFRNNLFSFFILFLNFFLSSYSYAAIDIAEDNNAFHVTSDKYSWLISKNELNVIENASVNENTLINGGQVSVDFLGSTSIFGAPSKYSKGKNWVELRGWADQSKNLWYIARYKFYDNNPLVGLSLTVTDRHDKTKTEGHYHPSWKERKISNLHIKLDSIATLPINNYLQHNSYSGGSKFDSFVEVISRTGVPYKWKRSNVSTNQLQHPNVGQSENKIIWHLKHSGSANLEASFVPFPQGRPDLIANNISYIVKHADGIDTVEIDLQNQSPIQLGQYNFDEDSTVTLVDSGDTGIMLADYITIKPEDNSKNKVIQLSKKLEDNVLQAAPLTLLVQDLWKNHPIEVYSTSHNIGIKAIKDPTILMGGMGKTFDIGISIAGTADDALALFNSPPSTIPDLSNWNDIDGHMSSTPEFLGLLGKVNQVVDTRDVLDDNFGWKNWGDFQIGNNYTNSSGVQIEDWASLQVDLPTGLLFSWLNTKDPQLWLRAKAAIRHSMDIDIVKFMPFRDKYAGASHRKGTCPVAESHICTEPVIDFSFGWRGLLLYNLITGEQWAKDVAQMQIDNSAYIAKTRKSYLLNGGRPAAWALRALIYGEKFFPEGTRYLSENTETPMPAHSSYREILDDVMTDLIALIIDIKKFPGYQPVWAGQGIETLAEYHQLTGNNDAKTAITLAVDHLMASTRDNNGVLEVMYNENTQQWVRLSNYGWLWLSSITYAYDLTKDQKYQDFGDKLYQQSLINLENEKSIRGWTSAIGSPWLYVKEMIGEPRLPLPPPIDQPLPLPHIVSDIKWSDTGGLYDPSSETFSASFDGVRDISSAYNNGRRQEESQLGLQIGSLGSLSLPPQTEWDNMIDDAKALWIINEERRVRANVQSGASGLPLAGIESHIDNISKKYGDLLHDTNATGHTQPSGNSSVDNLLTRIENDADIGLNCHNSKGWGENLAYFASSGNSIPLPLERSIYSFIYDDASSNWEHRATALSQNAEPNAENGGYLGVYVRGSSDYKPFAPSDAYGAVVVMNFFDPVSSPTNCHYNATLKDTEKGSIKGKAPTLTIPNNKWIQIGLNTSTATGSTVAEILGDDIAAPYGSGWAIFSYQTNINTYKKLSLTDTMSPGVGYWLIQATGSAVTIDMPGSSSGAYVTYTPACRSPEGCFEISLASNTKGTQWQMIGFPFRDNRDIDKLRIVTNAGACLTGCSLSQAFDEGLTADKLLHFNGASYEKLSKDGSESIEPWDGVWFETLPKVNGLAPKMLIPATN